LQAILPRFDFRADVARADDIGRERSSYEDAALVAPSLGVFAVADGMGGQLAGEVAARLAVEEVSAALGARRAQRAAEAYATRADLASRREMFAELRSAVARANDRVRREAAMDEQRRGMGTTLDVVWLARDHAFVAHAGDGRVYLARARAVIQITQDHTAPAHRPDGWSTQPIHHHPGLINAVGLSDVIAVDCAFVDVSRGDRLLLCTDGVYAQLRGEAEIAELLRLGDSAHAARALIQRAGQQGRDNATAIVVEIGERLVRRSDRDRGLGAADLERARQSPLLVDLPESFALSALAAAVEVEVAPGEAVPRYVSSDLVSYIVLEGILLYPTSGRRVGAGALIFPESLVGVPGQQESPVAEQTLRLLRVRADDFSEICSDPRLAAELYRRIAQHLARFAARLP
jgi:serine/threonine protein phosphatase PrpC